MNLQPSSAPAQGKAERFPFFWRTAAFLLPVLLMGGVFLSLGFYPAGQKSLLITDVWQQYVDLYAAFYDVLTGEGSLLFNWHGGMGLNFLGIFAYYLASPLSLLVLIFGRLGISDAIFAMVLIKTGIAGLSMSVFQSRSSYLRLSGGWNLLFSCCYALSAYFVIYTTNFMWLDNAMMLPLLILSTERLVEKKKMAGFSAVLLFCFLSNFYISYMSGIFAFLFFLFFVFAGKNRMSGKERGRSFARFFLATGVSAGLGAFLLLPAFRALTGTYLDVRGVSLQLSLSNLPSEVLAKLFPGIYDTITYGSPNLYFGLLPLLLVPLFFFSSGIRKKDKLFSGLILAFLLASLVFTPLYLAWHAFQPPTWFPARFSFVLVFFCLWLAGRGLHHWNQTCGSARGLVIKPVLISATVIFWILLYVRLLLPDFAEETALYITAGMTVLYAVILVAGIFVRPQAGKILLQALLLVCTLSELSISAGIMIQGMDAELQYHDREEYRLFTETYQPAAAYIQAQDPGFYRMENIDRRSSNDGYTLRYNGVSHYSSFSHQGVNLFLAQLGQHASVNDRFYKYYDATAVTDALCGVRYLLGGSRTEPIYRQVQVVNEIPIYQNTLALPVIYPARSEVLEFTPQSESRIENQEAFLQAAFGDGNVYTPAEMTKTAEDKYVFTVQEEGEAYLEARLTRSAGVWIWVNGQSRYLPEFGTYLIHIGYFYPGEEVTISIAMPDGARMADQPQLYSFSAEKFSNLTETARKTEVVQQGDTGLSVSCNTAEDRFYLTSIPADPGWELYLDGEKAGTSVMSRAFLAFSVPAGTEEIQLRYTPPGLRVGAGISIATAVLCLLYGLYTGFRRRYAGRALLDQLDKLDKKK